MHNPPRVSIGMPVYNGENYICFALDALLAQTFTDFELIICDNGSTDDTRQICETYVTKDQRVRYFRSEKNLGAALNYNRTFTLSSGQYFKWAAHDDLCTPEFLEQCVQVLNDHPEVVLCYARTRLINDQGLFEGYYADNLHLQSPKPQVRYRQFFDRQGLCHPIFGLIRTSALKRTPLIGNFHSSDRVLLGELVLYGKFYELSEPLFCRRIHDQISMTANKTESEVTSWYDPNKRGQLIFPRWRRLAEYIQGIHRAPLTLSERLGCYLVLLQLAVFPERWLNLARDVVRALSQLTITVRGHRARR
jgi:glycosyltransferase involved in cell wall biosynthesis